MLVALAIGAYLRLGVEPPPPAPPPPVGQAFMQAVEAAVPPGRTLGVLAHREAFLKFASTTTVVFDPVRGRDGTPAAWDAARWLGEAPDRVLLVAEGPLKACFPVAGARRVGTFDHEVWYLVSGPPDSRCATRGRAQPGRDRAPGEGPAVPEAGVTTIPGAEPVPRPGRRPSG